MMSRQLLPFLIFLSFQCTVTSTLAYADEERPNVAYTGVYLMGNEQAKSKFPIYQRNRNKLINALTIEMKKANEQEKLPFNLLFNTDMEGVKQRMDNTLSLAFLVVRDDITTESFNAAGATINKTIINVGLTAILYDTRKIDGKERNTVVFSFPLVGYSQRLDGDKKCADDEIDALFVDSAATALRENIIKRLAGVKLSDIFGVITNGGTGTATVNIGSTNGIEDGQFISVLVDGKKVSSGIIVKLEKNNALVELPKDFRAKSGMQIKTTNMRASSDETFQVTEVKVSSKKAAKFFPQELIGPQAAQWFSNFLTYRGGKVVLPSRVGGEWDQRATGTAFSLFDRTGIEHQFELPPPKYPVILDITGINSKVTDTNDVNDVCMFKAWMKINYPCEKA